MKKICFVNGSPRLKKATSLIFLQDLAAYFENDKYQKCFISISLKRNNPYSIKILNEMANSQAIIFSFPLYAYTLPAAFTKLIEDYYNYINIEITGKKRTKIYAIVNSGFPLPFVNNEALRVMKLFCKRAGLYWRFGVSIGGGMVVAMMRNIPIINFKLRKAYKLMYQDIKQDECSQIDDIKIKPVIPKSLMLYMKDSNWSKKFMAKQN